MGLLGVGTGLQFGVLSLEDVPGIGLPVSWYTHQQ